ncbi:MAG: ChbG/HpnK family deacetylase, partial [Verrucomicrobiota bacterium]
LRLGGRYFFLPHVRRQLATEIRAQFAAFAATGLTLSHADAHKHMHLHPTVGGLMIRIGREFGLQAIRIPAEPPAVMAACGVPASDVDGAVERFFEVPTPDARAAAVAVAAVDPWPIFSSFNARR